jgi:hypothetical protein
MVISSYLISFVGPGGVRLRLPALDLGNPYWSGLTESSGHNCHRDLHLEKFIFTP